MPKAKITKEMIVDAAFEVVRAIGIDNVNARTVSEKLGCSTQPVMYHFAKIEDMKRAAYEKADWYHTEYIMNFSDTEQSGVTESIPENGLGDALNADFDSMSSSSFDCAPTDSMMLGIGINYIRFAVKEPHLFHFLFESGYAAETSLLEMIDSEELAPVIEVMQTATGMSIQQTKDIFTTIALFSHGYASIIANNSLKYDEELVISHLERAYRGAMLAAQEDI